MTGEDRKTRRLGAIALVISAALITLILTGSIRALFDHHDRRDVIVEFRNSQTLRVGDDVRLAGVDVGEVTRVEFNPGGGTSRVTASIDRSAGPLYADARASVRWKTLLGGGIYLALDRGTARMGGLAGAIPPQRTTDQVELDDVTGVFTGEARRGFQRLPPELARTFRRPDTATNLLRELASQSRTLAAGIDTLRGTSQRDDLRELVKGTAATVAALDRPDDGLTRLISGAGQTVVATGGRADDIRAALRAAPLAMQIARTTFSRLQPTLIAARRLLADLRSPAAELGPALERVRPVAIDAAALLAGSRPLLGALRPAAVSLRRAAPRAAVLLQELRPSIALAANRILPALNRNDPQTQRSTATMIGGTFSNMGPGVGGQMDSNGHFIRFPATFGSSPTATLPCQTYFNNPDKPQMVACQSLSEALQTYLSYQPLGTTPGVEPPGARRKK